MAAGPLIDARDLSVGVEIPHQAEPLVVVDKASLSIQAGVSYAIVGRSGSGKTSLLSVLGLLNSGYTGTLSIDGTDAADLSDKELSSLRAERIGFVFQSYSLVAHLNALANVALPSGYAGTKRSAALLQAREALAEVGLADRAHAKPLHLSGGEQQRVAIARALVNRPGVVMADEPTGALDTDTGTAVMATLLTRVKQMNTALIIVTHDPDIAELCDQCYIMERGVLRPRTGAAVQPEARRSLPQRASEWVS